jgi:hypothetical protein
MEERVGPGTGLVRPPTALALEVLLAEEILLRSPRARISTSATAATSAAEISS